MTFNIFSRAGLMALILGVFLGICVNVSSVTPAYTQDVETLSCDSKVQKECSPNSGDTAWMLTSTAIVLMMTIPGLGLFYGGMVRKKNVGDTVMSRFAITCLVTIIWVVCTYSMAFTAGSPWVGGLSRAFLQGIVSDIAN